MVCLFSLFARQNIFEASRIEFADIIFEDAEETRISLCHISQYLTYFFNSFDVLQFFNSPPNPWQTNFQIFFSPAQGEGKDDAQSELSFSDFMEES